MNKEIFIVRHCAAEGQPSESELTELGMRQSIQLADFFSAIQIDQIISSPFLRAIESIKPTSLKKDLTIKIDDRLSERILSTTDLPDWLEKLEATFVDLELKFEGGESSQEALNRALDVIQDILNSDFQKTVIVTHGNLMSLLLMNYHNGFGFEDWKNLSNPDVFHLKFESSRVDTKRIWEESAIKSL